MSKIPVVFTFNDDYALPASIAIKSLLDYKNPDTEYEIIVLHGGLKEQTKQKFKSICKVKWLKIKLDEIFDAPPPDRLERY